MTRSATLRPVPPSLRSRSRAANVGQAPPKPVRLRGDGDGVYYGGPRARFKVVDEHLWSDLDRHDPERYQATDFAVPTTGCPNDHTDVVLRAPTLRAVADGLGQLLAEEAVRGLDPARERPDSLQSPRARFYRDLSTLADAGQISNTEFHQRLSDWEDVNCAQFRGGGPFVPLGGQRERILSALFEPTEEELRLERLADALRRGAEAARSGRSPAPTPDPTGSPEANAWLSGYYGELAKRG